MTEQHSANVINTVDMTMAQLEIADDIIRLSGDTGDDDKKNDTRYETKGIEDKGHG